MSTPYIRVNDFAPRDGKTTLYCKKVGDKKSDGFAVIENDKVYVIDAGRGDDRELPRFLLELRKKWLANQSNPSLLEDENARLEIHIIVSHPHPDHIAAFKRIFPDFRFCIMSILAPKRAYLSLDVPGALEKLTAFEDRLELYEKMLPVYLHTCREITRIPYGKKQTIRLPDSDTLLTLYPSQFDWSEDRPSESEGIRFLRKYLSPTYKDDPEHGYSNGAANGNSLWVKITKGNSVALITGDQRASYEMLGSMIRYYGEEEFRCDILKLPHHGEKNYPPDLLSIASPRFTIFTCAEGYDTPETQDICERISDVFYLRDGNLFFEITENSVTPYGISPRKR